MSELNTNKDQTVSVGEWIVTYIVAGLPIIGFIMTLVWAFGSDAKASKRNWARAALIIMVVGTILFIICFILFAATFALLIEEVDWSSYSVGSF